MSIGGIMRTSVSGMNAQANRLSAVSENIANSNTTGYKRATTEFASLVLPSSPGNYNSGVVQSQTRNLISQQGGLSYTTNNSSSQAIDLAINGKGFMVVSDGDGGTFLTRAGSYVKNGAGDLVNAAGFVLQGYPLPLGDTSAVANGYAGLVDVNLNAAALRLKPTDAGLLTVNVPKQAAIVPAYPTPATSALKEETAAFDIAGTAASVAGDRLNFSLTVDGRSYAIQVLAPAGGANAIRVTDVVAAINAAVGETVAFDDGGHLKLASPSIGDPATTPAGRASSSIALGAATITDSTGTITRTGTTFSGFTPGAQTQAATSGSGTASQSLPSENLAGSAVTPAFTAKESIVVYDNTGAEVVLDIYMTKTNHNEWEYAIFNRADEGAGTFAPFPYANGAIGAGTMTFGADGQMLTPAGGFVDFTVPNGQPMRLSLAGSTQLSAGYQTLASTVNGNPPENVDQISISADGIVRAEFKSGTAVNLFKIPLALVESPDNMTTLPGNVFSAGLESGSVLVGFGGESGLGTLVSGALEQSTVDLASELTTMIESQRGYTANSKVFQTGSEILDVLVNLKR